MGHSHKRCDSENMYFIESSKTLATVKAQNLKRRFPQLSASRAEKSNAPNSIN